MSVPSGNDNGKSGVKTLGIRFEPEDHALLSMIAQLRSRTITDEIRAAIEAHIDSAKHDPALADNANAAMEEIERDAAIRRTAIASLFASDGTAPTGAPTNPTTRRTSKV